MRIWIRSVLGLLIIVLLALTLALFLGWSQVPDIVSHKLSKALGVSVEIGDIHLSRNAIEIEDISLENLRGFQLPHALKAAKISIDAPLLGYLDKEVVIDLLEVDNLYLGLEFASALSTQGNWSKILQGSRSATNSSSPTRSVLIRKLVLTNIQTDLLYQTLNGKENTQVKHLPNIARIELVNISSKGGAPMKQILNSALGQMLQEVFIKQNIQNTLEDLLQNVPDQGSGWQQALKPLQGLFK